nr:type II toxin-antitoxin system RelE/ParE family toxin [Kingella kingae]
MKQQFKSALAKRLENPRIPSAALHNMPDCYKIKLRKIGYRLVYRVDDNVITVTVIAIGKRDKSVVYDAANSRL